MKKRIIALAVLLYMGQYAFSQESSLDKRWKCYWRDQHYYFEELTLDTDSTFVLETVGFLRWVTGRWRLEGDTMYLTYNKPHVNSENEGAGKLHMHEKYLFRNKGKLLIPVGFWKGKTRKIKKDDFWERNSCPDRLRAIAGE